MKNKKVLALTETAVMAAVSVVLSLIIIFKMPQGGSVTAFCMVPIVLMSYRRGYFYGVMCGIISGLLQFLLTGVALHPLSVLLDYILAYGVLGMASIFKGSLLKTMCGTALVVFARFVFHLVSGATIFASYAPESQNPWLYSTIYNGTYMLPELIITLVVVGILYKSANRVFTAK